MSENILIPYQELGKLLAKFRKSAKLSQAELVVRRQRLCRRRAERMGLSKKRGYCHISHLETGREKKPSLYTILLYLKACQVPWTTFFQKLSEIDFKIEHDTVMRQVYPAPFDKKSKDTTTSCECDITQPDKRGGVDLPSRLTPDLRQKVDRDTAKYLNKIQYPKTPFQKLDWERIKTNIDKKVKTLLFDHKLDEKAKQPYFTLTNEFITNYDTGQIPAIFQKHWQAQILNRGIIEAIRKIVYQTVKTEQKRLKKQKVLPSEKFRKMAGSFLRYRIKIEPIDPAPFYKMSGDKTISFECDITQPDKRGGVEAEVQKKLGELNVPIAQNQAYKDFVRECYKAIKKYYPKDPPLLTQKFTEITKAWKQMGLNEGVMEKVKEITLRVYKELLTQISNKIN